MKQILGILLVVFFVLFARGALSDGTTRGADSGVWALLQDIQTRTTQNILRATGGNNPAQINASALGEYSPHYNHITIQQSALGSRILGVYATHPADEYLILSAARSNTAPINITGWSLASMISNEVHYISGGAKIFAMGEINNAEPIYLAPGETAIVSSGYSPVGVSFKTNMCTGYLNSTQYFEPPLENTCPIPATVLPATPHNITTFGDACISFVETFPRCSYLTTTTRGIGSLAPLCQEALKRMFTYTTCVEQNKNAAGFSGDTWRVYLGSATEVWRNEHEIIRLADENGKTVDVVNY